MRRKQRAAKADKGVVRFVKRHADWIPLGNLGFMKRRVIYDCF